MLEQCTGAGHGRNAVQGTGIEVALILKFPGAEDASLHNVEFVFAAQQFHGLRGNVFLARLVPLIRRQVLVDGGKHLDDTAAIGGKLRQRLGWHRIYRPSCGFARLMKVLVLLVQPGQHTIDVAAHLERVGQSELQHKAAVRQWRALHSAPHALRQVVGR